MKNIISESSFVFFELDLGPCFCINKSNQCTHASRIISRIENLAADASTTTISITPITTPTTTTTTPTTTPTTTTENQQIETDNPSKEGDFIEPKVLTNFFKKIMQWKRRHKEFGEMPSRELLERVWQQSNRGDVQQCIKTIVEELALHSVDERGIFEGWLHGLSLVLYHSADNPTLGLSQVQELCRKVFDHIPMTSTQLETGTTEVGKQRQGSWQISHKEFTEIITTIISSINISGHSMFDTIDERTSLQAVEWIIDCFLRKHCKWIDNSFINQQWKHYFFKHGFLSLLEIIESVRGKHYNPSSI
ncbi:hypothetical protein RFI_30133 [Reticulomyxa filosa]|uniref:Uncharacterized protein n=1 Tax=Reticulomyxa filosa TaxID=46433 RepID=X6M0X4_RETFI|nr:hypothetical protein RFI_30133 [Reticulomyxa filosa]|eukprot:ETO07261.1 hypothetical protein RFI_30133 [Reticulomyxa filosa]